MLPVVIKADSALDFVTAETIEASLNKKVFLLVLMDLFTFEGQQHLITLRLQWCFYLTNLSFTFTPPK